MNERLQQLASEAGHFEFNKWDYFDIGKFAELIVRECIERVREQYIPIRDQTVEGKLSPIHTQLRLRTERETGVIECGINSVIALEELIQEQTDKWYKENILGDENAD